jgi:hypothetical protein
LHNQTWTCEMCGREQIATVSRCGSCGCENPHAGSCSLM